MIDALISARLQRVQAGNNGSTSLEQLGNILDDDGDKTVGIIGRILDHLGGRLFIGHLLCDEPILIRDVGIFS